MKAAGRCVASGLILLLCASLVSCGAIQKLQNALNPPSPLSIATSSLPMGTVSTAYSTTLTATGGNSPYFWNISSGSLPAGLSLSSGGTISGTPTIAGTSTFSVQVTDAQLPPKSVSQALSLVVNPAQGGVSISTTSLPQGNVNVAYSATLAATGGTGPYQWTVIAGTLPAGLSLASNGAITGSPMTVGTSNFTVQVLDSETVPTGTTANLTITIAAALVSFSEQNFASGGDGKWAITADFNGDGHVDIAVPTNSSTITGGADKLSIFLGNGDGTFASVATYSAGALPWSVATGDFNGDGILDIAVTNWGDGTVSILLGKGDGTFGAASNYRIGGGGTGVLAKDLNGDGKLDLVISNFASNSVTVLLGNGDGTFSPHADYPTGVGPDRIVVGEFNGDGKLDVAVDDRGCPNLPCSADGLVSVLLGNGDGTLQPHVDYSTGPGSGPDGIAAGDFNGDGKLDLAVSNSGTNNISILLGNGDGTFQTPMNYSTGSFPESVALGDFNGDGNLDLLVSQVVVNQCPLPATAILLGKGDGTFGAPNYLCASAGFASVAADFNGDGKLDFVTADDGSQISVWTNTGTSAGNNTTTASLFPSNIDFGGVTVGNSAVRHVILTNTGSSTLNLHNITVSGSFVQQNTCGSALLAGSTCSFTLTFTPTSTGPASGSLALTDNGQGGSQTVALGGLGTP